MDGNNESAPSWSVLSKEDHIVQPVITQPTDQELYTAMQTYVQRLEAFADEYEANAKRYQADASPTLNALASNWLEVVKKYRASIEEWHDLLNTWPQEESTKTFCDSCTLRFDREVLHYYDEGFLLCDDCQQRDRFHI